MKYFAFCVAACVGLGASFSAWSAGLTLEQESLIGYRSGRMPAVLSSDGEWLVYLDGDSVLHRRNVNSGSDQKTMLFRTPKVISTSHNGEKVVVSKDGCISVVDFGKGHPSVRHLKRNCETIANADLNYEPGDGFDGSLGLAIANDAKLVAFDEAIESDQRKIVLINSTNSEVVTQIPVVGETLHIQFVDQDSKLLVVQGIFGESLESAADPSALQFSLWDLKNRKLFAFFESPLVAITGETLMWSFSEATGDLFAVGQTSGQFNRDTSTPVSILKFNLKQCRASSLSLKLKGQAFTDFKVDPLGRWIATVEDQKLILRKPLNGEILFERDLEKITRSLVPSIDGKTLFGIETGAPEKVRFVAFEGVAYSGGGKFIDIELASKTEGLPAQNNPTWAEACRIEDEAVGARQISAVGAPAKLYEINLGEPDLVKAMPELPNCYSPVNYEHGAVFNKWGLSDDGHLWIDSYDHLSEIELLTRKAISRLPVSRSETQCNLAVFSKRLFLNWQNDKVTVVPFDKASAEKIFVHKAGKVLSNITQKGNWVGIAWAGFEEDSNAKVPVIYDVGTGKEIVTLPSFFTELEVPDFAYMPQLNELKAGSYQWEVSHVGSVRAYFRSVEDQKISTVLWDGLSYSQGFDARLNDSPLQHRKVIDLGFGIAAMVQLSGVTLYNASTKKRYAEISLLEPRNVVWSEKNHILLVEAMSPPDKNGKSDWLLHAYKVD